MLRQRRPALSHTAGAQVAKERSKESDRIDARVVPEANIFGRDDGILQRLRHLIERDRTPVFELIVEDRRQQLRFERGIVDRRRAFQRDHRGDAAAVKRDAHRLRRILAGRMRERPRVDVHLRRTGNVVASLGESADLPVAEAIQFFREVVGPEDDAAAERREVGEDPRRQRQAANLELSDRLFVDVEGQDRDQHEHDDDRDRDHLKDGAAARETCVERGQANAPQLQGFVHLGRRRGGTNERSIRRSACRGRSRECSAARCDARSAARR